MKLQRSGLTLIELLIVLTVIVAIAGLGTPSLMRMNARSRTSSAAKELQAELNRTRLKAIKSGEPLVLHYQTGSGDYEIMSKQEFDRLFPPLQDNSMNAEVPGMSSDMGTSFGFGDANMMGAETAPQIAGSTGPSAGDLGSNISLSDIAGNAPPSFGSLEPPPSLGDLGAAPTMSDVMSDAANMQQIAVTPISKIVPERKTLPEQLIFANGSKSPIYFFPNGRTSDVQLLLRSGSGHYRYQMELSIRGLTGTATLGQLSPEISQ